MIFVARDERARNIARLASKSFDALVVGGGVAGSALAISLAKAGRAVLLLEKSAAAHPKMCGEFLSFEALHYLAVLGIDVKELGALPIEHVQLAGKRRIAAAPLPFAAMSLSRACLDEVLLQLAAKSGVHVLRKQRVVSLALDGRCWKAGVEEGIAFTGRDAFLATGKNDLYGWNRPPGRQNDLIAFKMYWQLASSERAALERHVELVLFPGGYAGLQLVEEGAANLCLLIQKAVFRKLGGSWPQLLAHLQSHSPHLAARLAGATALWERPLTLSSIPYGFVREHACDGLWRLGDQSAVIPSFAGDGMSIALHSAMLAAAMYVEGKSAEQYQQRLTHDVDRQVRRASLLSQALVRGFGQPILGVGLRLWPGILAAIARSTRIHGEDIVRLPS